MRVVEVEAVTIDLADLLQLAIDQVESAGREAMAEVAGLSDEQVACAAAYYTACHDLAHDLQAAGDRFDSAVLRHLEGSWRHLEGSCKAH